MRKSTRGNRPVLERGEQVDGVVFPGGRRPMARGELTRTLAPIIARWIKAACLWDEGAAIGDHRFVVFSIDVAPRVQVYVQFWSEPGEPVLWEVSSGRWNPPADKWLAGERSTRIEAFGFEIGGQAENFQREVVVATPADANRIARTVVDVCYACFEYRGLQPIEAFMAYESRAEPRLTYDAFTPEDLVKVLDGCGFAAEVVDASENAPVIHAVRRGITTTIVCAERVEEEHLFRRALLTSEVEVAATVAHDVREAMAPVLAETDHTIMTLGTTLMFDGGVTLDWLVQRLREWDAMTWAARAASRKRKAPKPRVKEKVH